MKKLALLVGLLICGSLDAKEINTHRNVAVGDFRKEQQASYEVKYTGIVEAVNQSQLSFERAGKVVKLHADFFDYVQKGQLLGEQEASTQRATKDALVAAIDKHKAEKVLLEAAYERALTLMKKGEMSVQQFEEAHYRLTAVQLNLKQLNAELDKTDLEVKRASIYAPYDGVITNRLVDFYEVVSPGQTVFTIVNPFSLRAKIGFPADFQTYFKANQEVKLTIGSAEVPGILVGRDIQEIAKYKTVAMHFKLITTDVLPGELAGIKVFKSIAIPGYWVPTSSLVAASKGRWSVYRVSSENQVVRAYVDVQYINNDMAYITGELGDVVKLIVDGVNSIVPGQTIAYTD